MVGYELDAGIARITLDDGKVNVLSPAVLAELNAALDRAERDDAVVLLAGRDGVFSAGFDLTVLRSDGDAGPHMVRSGFELALRVLEFPRPVVIACTGHAVAMGLFLVLSADYRVGADGPYRFAANEVAIGLTIPNAACEILRQRLAPAYYHRAAILAETFAPGVAVDAGILDRVVAPARVLDVAGEVAASALTLDRDAHAASKLRARRHFVTAIREGLEADTAALAVSA